jgi:Zn-finger nucleic acid-binding protein
MMQPAIACPNCQQPMQARDLERHDLGVVRVDLCFSCAGIWFDHLESTQLAPSGVIELFKAISANQSTARRPVANRLSCPRCSQALLMTYDLSKAGRFSYYRCPSGEGRYTPFFQFLREKQFVRALTPVELQRVRVQIRQINCSECGAPIDLEHDTQCKYCHAPVSFLDPEAVERAVKMWADAESRQHLIPTQQALGHTLQHLQLKLQATPESSAQGLGMDLVEWGIHAIGRLLDVSP